MMNNRDLLILKGPEILALLQGQERQLIRTVSLAYQAHAREQSSLPHSVFLRFPGNDTNRIIALPAYLGDRFEVAGLKWVSSFPGNLDRGIDRAMAVLILNSPTTGRPEAIMEGSLISAKRTAASAALAAQCLQGEDRATRAGIIGCGLINFEIVRMLRTACPEVRSYILFDTNPERASHFRQECLNTFGDVEVEIAEEVKRVLNSARLISIATTAIKPHLFDLSGCVPGTTILHISLRDLSPELILSSDNVVDDVDHVCRAQTSVHLAEQLAGNREFINCTLGDVLRNRDGGKRDAAITVFSPFGLGILDIALGKFIYDLAIQQGSGSIIESFLPAPWTPAKTGAIEG
jgi:2,3-diaminopropionate biosynthesis protein SbnB